MKKHLLFSYIILILCGLGKVSAQQMTLEMSRFANPGAFSPAAPGGKNPHSLWLGYQQQGNGDNGFRYQGQFLHLNTGGLGLGRRIGWGMRLAHSQMHTERRISFAPQVGVQFVENEKLTLGTGISLGFLNWASNYSDVYIAQTGDPILQQPWNFWELDAGLGFAGRLNLDWMRADLALTAGGLPSNFLSSPVNALDLHPYLHGGGGILFKPTYNMMIGPRVQYHNVGPDSILSTRYGTIDLGLQLAFERQQLWIAAAYRPGAGNLLAGFGLHIIRPDTNTNKGFGLEMQAMGSYPVYTPENRPQALQMPSVELGLRLIFARKAPVHESTIDTMRYAAEFWEDDGKINIHRVKHLDPTGPTGLTARTSVIGKRVILTYDFPDNSYIYFGEDGLLYKDSLASKVGEEWYGVDPLMKNIITHVVEEGFHPDSSNIRDPENIEPLKRLVSLELGCNLQVDESGARMGLGIQYLGDLGTNNETGDSLIIQLNYDGSDTTIVIGTGQYVSNLELAALKVHAMRKKLQYELMSKYRGKLNVVWEGQYIDTEIMGTHPIVTIRRPRIISNNPNQSAFYHNLVLLRFERDEKYVIEKASEEEALFEEVVEEEDPKSKKKHPKKKKTKKVTPQPTTPDAIEGTFEADPPPAEAPPQDLFDDTPKD